MADDKESLHAIVFEALRHYSDVAVLQQSRLNAFEVTRARIVHAPEPTGSMAGGVAVQRLLAEALTQLKARRPELAILLERRFLHNVPPAELGEEMGQSEGNIYKQQRRAVGALASIIAQMETEALETRRRRFLPPQTYVELVGFAPQLQQIGAALTAGMARPGLPLVVTGLGGIGKTSLVREALVRWPEEERGKIERLLFVPLASQSGSLQRGARYALEEVIYTLGQQAGVRLEALPDNEQRLRELARRLTQM
ncbi:MAG: hypothetical protein ACRDIB_16645, partial [Ardenticatenaceae bacterium]